MASGREIKTKIKSVQNTRKVTRALEMVSASKIRKAQDRMKASRPYASPNHNASQPCSSRAATCSRAAGTSSASSAAVQMPTGPGRSISRRRGG